MRAKSASIRSYPVVDSLGAVMAWFDPDGGEASGEVVLDARGAISVSERTGYIARVRNLARMAAQAYVAKREALGFPLLKTEGETA